MVAFRTINRLYSQKIYWLLPSYEQEGEAIQTLLEKQNLNRVSYINQQEERFFKPLEFIKEDKIKIISSVNIPFNSRFGQHLTSCDDRYYKSRLTLEILKAIRLYGSSIMQADICWQSFIFNFANSSRMNEERFAQILGLESSSFINPNIQKEVQNRSSVHLSILDDGLIALTPLGFIPQSYFDFSMHYIRKLLNFINKMYQDNNHQLDLAFTQQFQNYQSQLFDDQGQSISEFSVFNMQNKIPIEVFQILHQQVVDKAKILYPGPTYDPPPQKLTIDISYSTNAGGPENENYIAITLPPYHLPCVIDYVNNDFKLFENYILKGTALSYGGLHFDLNFSLTYFKQNFKKLGVAHQAPIMILG